MAAGLGLVEEKENVRGLVVVKEVPKSGESRKVGLFKVEVTAAEAIGVYKEELCESVQGKGWWVVSGG